MRRIAVDTPKGSPKGFAQSHPEPGTAMIIRTIGDEIFLTPQPRHAAASALLAARIRPEFLDPPTRNEVIRATHHHDDGWREWEQAPDRHPDGRPRNFTELETRSHVAIWRRGVQEAIEQLPAAAAVLIARHASQIVEGRGENKDFIADALQSTARRAWPTLEPDERNGLIAANYAVLATCDVLTLMVCADWPDHTLEVLAEEGTRSTPIPARRDGLWDLVLGAWPFEGQQIEIGVEMLRFKKPVRWDAVLSDVAADRWNWRQPVLIRPE